MIDALIERIRQTGNPSVVGLDPRLDFVPPRIVQAAFAAHGETLEGAAEAFYRFNVGIIDAVRDIVPAVKPQVALYEQYGAAGVGAYLRTIQYAKAAGMVVIGDIKRGDISSTAVAYSNGHIGRVAVGEQSLPVFDADFITVSPYMGYDSIDPYLDDCRAHGKGLFVLVKTSNPGGGDIQDLPVDGRPLYEIVGLNVARIGEAFIGGHGYSAIGAVVGATKPEQAARLRKLLPRTFFLVPGYGAQGGAAKDALAAFDGRGGGAIVNSSRGIIAAYTLPAYKNAFTPENYAAAARQAALDMRADLTP